MIVLWTRSCGANGVRWPSANRAARLMVGSQPVISYKAGAGANIAADFWLSRVFGFQAGATITASVLFHTPANSGNYAFRLNLAAVKAGEDPSAGLSYSATNVNFDVAAVPGVANQLALPEVEVDEAAFDGFADGDPVAARLTLLDGSSTCAQAIYVHELNLRQEL